ncbi:hypothetical protein B0H19DRAFT_1010516 [Mycena capillaripes]|nr:hypothetical protein B0H19DRAFT_1010516 [Mycena capillaripes]
MRVVARIAATLLLAGSFSYAAVIDDPAQAVLRMDRISQCPHPDAPSFTLYRSVNPDTERSRYTAVPQPAAAAHDGFEFDAVVARVFDGPHPHARMVPLYHLFEPITRNSFYTRDPLERERRATEVDGAYVDMGVAAYVFPQRVCGARPLFRLFKRLINGDACGDGTHFYTADVEERDEMLQNEGYTDPVILGYVLVAGK